LFNGKVWPNPISSGNTLVNIEKEMSWTEQPEFRLIDLLGRSVAPLLLASENTSSYQLQLPDHKLKGIFFLEIKTKESIHLKELLFISE